MFKFKAKEPYDLNTFQTQRIKYLISKLLDQITWLKIKTNSYQVCLISSVLFPPHYLIRERESFHPILSEIQHELCTLWV